MPTEPGGSESPGLTRKNEARLVRILCGRNRINRCDGFTQENLKEDGSSVICTDTQSAIYVENSRIIYPQHHEMTGGSL